MAKSEYFISLISKSQAAKILLKFHYLKDISKGFKSGFNVGLFRGDVLVGACIFTGFPVPELVKGAFGLDRKDQSGFFELSRFCIEPKTQSEEHNISSWFVSRSIRLLKSKENVRAILSYADSGFHSGIIYKASNFNYYGMTARKKDFWIKKADGSFVKHSRGKTKGVDGEWRERTRKHRYMIVLDKRLNVLWEKQPYPK
jgi:hypothetical protein